MFRIQKKIIYAIEAVIDIALNSGPGLVQNEDVAKRQGIPKRYLEQTLQILVRNKILVGSRGPRGGYCLAKERRKISILEIIKSVSQDDKKIMNYNSDISQKIIIPLIQNSTNECFEKFESITIEQLCKIAKNKNIQKNVSKKVDFVI